jgi:hypothetical protein
MVPHFLTLVLLLLLFNQTLFFEQLFFFFADLFATFFQLVFGFIQLSLLFGIILFYLLAFKNSLVVDWQGSSWFFVFFCRIIIFR